MGFGVLFICGICDINVKGLLEKKTPCHSTGIYFGSCAHAMSPLCVSGPHAKRRGVAALWVCCSQDWSNICSAHAHTSFPNFPANVTCAQTIPCSGNHVCPTTHSVQCAGVFSHLLITTADGGRYSYLLGSAPPPTLQVPVPSIVQVPA